jgi:hypothetical protein
LSSQLCCFVQEGTRVQYLKNLRVGETDSVPTSGAQKGQCAGDLASPRRVESLQKTPVTAGWQKKVFRVGKSFWPVAADYRDVEILINHDHNGIGRERSVVGIDVSAAEERILCQVPVKRRLELLRKVPLHKASKDRTVFRR